MSLRVRVVALIGTVLLVSLLLGSLVAGYQARQVLRDELSSALVGARQTVTRAFEDLPNSDHQDRDLHQLIATFDGNRHIRAVLIGAGRPVQASTTQAVRTRAPGWFAHLLGPPPPTLDLPTPAALPGYGAIRLEPTPDIDVGSAWEEFSEVVGVLAGTAVLGLLAVHGVIGAAFIPLRTLSAEFSKIGAGDYSGRVPERGPRELLSLQRGFNAMAVQLAGATERNRHLTDQLLTIQDEERADIARDLHDEIGPHLFGVTVDAEMAIKEIGAGRPDQAPEHLRAIQTAVSHMQRQVRDLLGRLRPARATEFGLNAALADLLTFWTARRPDIAFDLKTAGEQDPLPDAVKEAAYRLIQEAANNAVRHGDPTTVHIKIDLPDEGDLVITVLDDGRGPGAEPKTGGLGLIGMHERVAALGGSVVFGTSVATGGWSVVARLPVPKHDAATAKAPAEALS